MSEFRSHALLLALTAALAGCVPSLAGNPVREPQRELPASFSPDAPAGETAAAAPQDWRELFNDPALRGLIDGALQNNQELNVRLQELIIAQAEIGARRGEFMPRVGVGTDIGVEKVGRHTSQGAADHATGLPENLGDFRFGLTASWEIDVWGKLRAATNAARARFKAAIEGKNFVVTQIVAELARSYYELLSLDSQMELLEQTIALQESALGIVKAEKQAARVTELAVLRFEAELLHSKSRLFDVEQARVVVQNRINFLTGRFPQPVARTAGGLPAALPPLARNAVPASLLDHRPDVRQAAFALQAAKFDVQTAKASFYPSLSIEAGLGYEAFNPKHLLSTPDSVLYNLGGNLTAPLLNRAGIEAQYRSANARQIQAVFEYERTVLQAFTDVANQLASLKNLQQRLALQQKQVETLRKAAETSLLLFQSARADYMEVLLTRRDAVEAQLEWIETRERLFLATIQLYQALGGGWRSGS